MRGRKVVDRSVVGAYLVMTALVRFLIQWIRVYAVCRPLWFRAHRGDPCHGVRALPAADAASTRGPRQAALKLLRFRGQGRPHVSIALP